MAENPHNTSIKHNFFLEVLNMHSEFVKYSSHDLSLHGYLAYDDRDKEQRPAILIAHAWKGQDEFAREKARMLADLGYVGFAVDVYGNGQCVESAEEAKELMIPLFIDRKALRERIAAAFQVLSTHHIVDSSKIGAIGFCFGGLTVIELLKSGAELNGVVSFHGLLGDSLGEIQAQTLPPAEHLHGSLLILHGYRDPMVSQDDIVKTQTEFSKANVDWQMHLFGKAFHAFTSPEANEPESGLLYDSKAERRSLFMMRHFFEEAFA
ncbi:MAG: dienelactone hydrolase family protein [Waddliaceae bacterium]